MRQCGELRNLGPGLKVYKVGFKCRLPGAEPRDQVTSPIYRTRSIIVLDLVKKTHRCNAQRAGKCRFLILEFLLF